MKKLIVLLLSFVLVLLLMTGCRKQTNGKPGEPTVNNSSTAATVPSMTTKATHPSTEPTRHTTVPDTTMETGNGATANDDLPLESATNSNARNRDRMIPRR